jgi:hypothetical protein
MGSVDFTQYRQRLLVMTIESDKLDVGWAKAEQSLGTEQLIESTNSSAAPLSIGTVCDFHDLPPSCVAMM